MVVKAFEILYGIQQYFTYTNASSWPYAWTMSAYLCIFGDHLFIYDPVHGLIL